MNAAAIIAAIRGVLRGELGSVRTVPAYIFGDGLPPAMGADDARRLRVALSPSADVVVSPARRTGAVGPHTASRAVLAADVVVVLTYGLSHVADAEGPTHRDAVRAQAMEDARVVAEALTWPGNLELSTDGSATGLVSGLLTESEPPRVRREDWTRGIYEVELRFLARVLKTQAVA